MSTTVTPLPVEASPTDKGQRLQFFRSEINKNPGNWIVFDELLVGNLQDILNLLDENGFEIYDVKPEPQDRGHRALWIVLAYRVAEVVSS